MTGMSGYRTTFSSERSAVQARRKAIAVRQVPTSLAAQGRSLCCYSWWQWEETSAVGSMPQGLAMRYLRVAVASALALLVAASAAKPQDSYPSQNVKFVVAFPAGGPTDAIARIIGQRLAEKWGQGVVVENRGGAGGNIAARQIAKAEANGYTVLVTTSAFAVNPSLTANACYVPEAEFKTAIVAATTPNIIVASKNLKASNLAELIAAAKAEKLTYGMPGPGTTPHLSAERIFRQLAKVDIPPVPFTGAAPLLNALVGGHITLVCQACRRCRRRSSKATATARNQPGLHCSYPPPRRWRCWPSSTPIPMPCWPRRQFANGWHSSACCRSAARSTAARPTCAPKLASGVTACARSAGD